ncbi:glycosyltransferase [Infirmifilum sp.]|uniref:glycosyltransferase n=1 Tax=Infirmifilum sp. TaxID=2856575 RepID=UPI003D13ACBE
MTQSVFVTGFDPLAYRRPLFAKKAIPGLKIISYKYLINRFGKLRYIPLKMVPRIAKVESLFTKLSTSGGDRYVSALLREFFSRVALTGLKVDLVIALNPYLASRRVWGDNATIIVDWMDVWMDPQGSIHPLDVRILREADGIIFWGRPLMEVAARKLGLQRFTYIPYGVDPLFNPPRFGDARLFRERYRLGDSIVFMYSGGIWKVNGVDLQGTDRMLAAFASAARRLKNAVLVLQVSRMDSATLRAVKALRGRVRVLGPLPYASFLRQSAFAAADVLLAPSSRHPTAFYAERMKLFQYMAAGRAILAERTPGATSALGDAAMYVELGSTERLVEAMVELGENKELREELGAKARERARLFTWTRLAPKYAEFVRSIREG